MKPPASAKRALAGALSLALAGSLCPSPALAQSADDSSALSSAPAQSTTRAQAAADELSGLELIERLAASVLDASDTAQATESSSASAGEEKDGASSSANSLSSSTLPASLRKAAVLEDGTYRLCSAANQKRTVAVRGASLAQGANVQLAANAARLDAQWQIASVGNGYYRIQNAKTGKVLTCAAASGRAVAGSNVVQKRWKKRVTQKWKLVDEGSGRFALVSALDRNACLEISSSKAASGANVRLGTYAKKRTQQFVLKQGSAQIERAQLTRALAAARSSQGVTAFNGGTFDAGSSAGKRFLKAIEALRKRNMRCSVVMLDLTSGAGISCAADAVYFGASTAKGPYVASLCKNQQEQARSVKAVMVPTIKESSNSDYESLRLRFGAEPEEQAMAYAGVPSSAYGTGEYYPYLSARNLARLWVGNYWYFFKDTNGTSGWCRNLFTNTKCSYINQALGSTYQVYSKAGWDDSTDNVHNDAALVMDSDHPYLLVCMTTAYTHDELLQELACAADELHSEMVN